VGSGELEETPRSLRVRAFFGLPLPEPQRDELARFIAECAQVAPDFRWTPAANLHLTIRFIGNADRPVVEAVADTVAGRSLSAFQLGLGGIGTFGRGRMTRVVWLGLVAGVEAAAALASAVDEECRRVGLAGEERPFRAHLTLARARAREGARLPDLPAAPELGAWRARELILYSSRPARSGSVYEAIRTVALK
jgi:2'-5' RNA ligase